MTVFEAFPSAIEIWELLKLSKATEIGDVAEVVGRLRVIVADGDDAKLGRTPDADSLDADLLLYTRPEDLPFPVNTSLLATYGVRNTEGFDYQIVSVGSGKNQQTGETEHYELAVKMTEFNNGE